MASAFFLPLLEDGTRARRKCRETARTLEARGLESTGEGNIRWANGDEALEFANGSLLWVVAPHAGAFRSEAADAMLFDEAGELDPVKSEDLLAGALPLLDTRPMRQAIIAGTPAKTRAGLLWDTIEEGRRGDPGAGIVEYSIRDDEPSVLHPDGPDGPAVLNVEVLQRVHPGVGTLTTMAWMEQRFAKMDLATFEREYLCRFPFDASSSAIDLDSWAAAAVPVLPRPERFGLAFDVAPDGSSAAVCAAWRDEDGLASLGVLEHRNGVSWLARHVHDLAKRYRIPVRYDGIGANHGPAADVDRLRGVRLVSGTAKEAQAAAQRIVSALADGRLRHFDQASLTTVAGGAAWRQSEGGRYFARRRPQPTSRLWSRRRWRCGSSIPNRPSAGRESLSHSRDGANRGKLRDPRHSRTNALRLGVRLDLAGGQIACCHSLAKGPTPYPLRTRRPERRERGRFPPWSIVSSSRHRSGRSIDFAVRGSAVAARRLRAETGWQWRSEPR